MGSKLAGCSRLRFAALRCTTLRLTWTDLIIRPLEWRVNRMNDLSIGERNILKNELLTVKEVAAYLRVSRITVWRWCQQGTIPAFQIGRNWRIHRDDLLNLKKTSDLPSA